MGNENNYGRRSWHKKNSEEAKENELCKTSHEFRLSNEFRSEGGKNAHSLYICPSLERVSGQQSHISVKEFIPISSLRVYLESTRFTMVNNKSLYSMTWHFGEVLNRYFYLKLIFNLDSQWPTPWTLLFLHQIHYKVRPLQPNICFINTYFYFHIHFLLTRIANLKIKR